MRSADSVALELERLNELGETPVYLLSEADREWFDKHPLRAATPGDARFHWPEVLPTLIAWLRHEEQTPRVQNCGYPEGTLHLHNHRCFQAGYAAAEAAEAVSHG